MMNTIARRIKRLEDREFRSRAEQGPNLAAILLEQRRKRAIAEGREPEPDRPPGRLTDSSGRRLSLADVLLQNRKRLVPVESMASHALRQSGAAYELARSDPPAGTARDPHGNKPAASPVQDSIRGTGRTYREHAGARNGTRATAVRRGRRSARHGS
jgi:hypothetical protein